MIIDCESNTVCATIDVEENPCALAWNPIQNRVYVANYFSSSVSVIRDSIVGVEENNHAVVNCYDFGKTIFRGSLHLPEDKKCRVMDITGRFVEPSTIKPGIYFIEVDGVVVQKVVKVR